MRELLHSYGSYLMTRQRVASNTYLAYMRDVEQFIDFYEGQKEKDDLRSLLVDYRDNLLSSGTSARSLARKLSALRSFFNYLREYHPQQLAHENPVELIGRLPKMERRLPRICTSEDIIRLVEAAREEKLPERAELICLLLYTAGLRVSELVQLTYGALHLPTKQLKIKGKGGKTRMIPLIEVTCKALELYSKQGEGPPILRSTPEACLSKFRASSSAEASADRSGGKQSYLFPQEKNKKRPVTRQMVWDLLKRLARRAGLALSISPHVLRHAVATHSLEEGWDLRSLQLFLGHERIVTTEMYIHLDTRFVKAEYKKRHPRG